MTRFLDSRGRLFGRVNIVDLVVLLVLVAVVVFVAMRFTTESPETVPVQVTYLVKSVDVRSVEALRVTGPITDTGGASLGTVESVEVTPTVVELVTPEGDLQTFDSAINRDALIVATGSGQVSGSTVHIGRTVVRVGAIVTLVGPGYEAQARIVNVVWGAEAVK
jgi:hypothetical protein